MEQEYRKILCELTMSKINEERILCDEEIKKHALDFDKQFKKSANDGNFQCDFKLPKSIRQYNDNTIQKSLEDYFSGVRFVCFSDGYTCRAKWD